MIDNFNAMPVGIYEKAVEICNSNRDDLEKQVALIALLNNTTEEAVLALSLTDYADFAGKLGYLSNPMPKAAEKACKSFNLGGLHLDAVADARKMTAAQYIDFQTMTANPKTPLAYFLTCVLVPKGKAYGEGYDMESVRAAISDNLPIPQAVGVLGFFVARSLRSMLRLATSSALIAATTRKSKRMEVMQKAKAVMKATETMLGAIGCGASMPSARCSGVRGARFSL
jgi:hypothetical protein